MKKLGSSGLGAFPQTAKVKLSDFLRNEEGKVGSRAAFGAASMAFAGAAAMLAMPNTAAATPRDCEWLCRGGSSGWTLVSHCFTPCYNIAWHACRHDHGIGWVICS